MKKIAYDMRTDDTTQELVDRLSESQINSLTDELRRLGYAGWLAWFFARLDRCEDMLSATDQRRERLIAEQTGAESLLAQFGAIWLSQFAHVAHVPFQDPRMDLRRDSRQRRAARGLGIATAFHALRYRSIGWPFPGPCPFEKTPS